MQAVVSERYGSPDVMEFRRVSKPVPAANEVLIKVIATGLNAADWHLLRADPFFVRFSEGLLKPRKTILGADVAGRVEAIGKDVTLFKPGDAVFGELMGTGSGGLAEYATAPEAQLALKPPGLTFEETAAVPMAALTALQGLRDYGHIRPGMKVLINGASGGVGTFAVQIAKAMGAEVTAVCSTGKMDQARELGADHVIDYTREDFTRNGQQYDLILAANGNRTLGDYERALAPTGVFVMAGGSYRQMFQTVLLGSRKSKPGGKTYRFVSAKASVDDLIVLTEMIEAGQVRPVIDRRYPLSEAAEAMRYLYEGHARGKIVIIVDPKAAATV
jgi:NADPH:quinone reductase-like Zn-dependent oxidoreductase